MEELTIKVNKTVLFSAGFLIVGIIVGLALGGSINVGITKKDNGGQAVLNNQPVNNNQPAAAASPQITLSASDHLTGAKNAQVVLVEYSDFQCPYCKSHHPTLKRLMQEYGNKIAWVYRHFPLSSHQNAQISAEASECAAEQGKFWEYIDVLFTKGQGDGTGLTPPELEQYAKDLKLNSSQFESCLANKKYASRVNADFSSGGAAGVDGTPAVIILKKDGTTELVSGAVPYETLKAVIDGALK